MGISGKVVTFLGYPCVECDRPVFDWAAGQDEWETVMGDWNAGHICADCFMRKAHDKQVHLHVVRYCSDGET